MYSAPIGTTSLDASWKVFSYIQADFDHFAYHARAWENIPTQTDTVSVLHLPPLLFHRLEVHVTDLVLRVGAIAAKVSPSE